MSGNLGLCLPNMLPSNRDKPLRWTDEMCEERMSKDNVLQNRKINVLKKEARHHQRDPAQQHNITTSRIYPAFLQGKVNYTTCHYLQCLLRFSVLDISCHYKKSMQMQAKLRLKCLNMQTKKIRKRQFNVTSVPKNTIIYCYLLYYPSLEGLAILLQYSNFFHIIQYFS